MSRPDHQSESEPIVLFDGVCNLCNNAVDFIIKRDRNEQFKFASLQSETGEDLARRHGIDVSKTNSVVLIDGGQAYVRSAAALKIAKKLDAAWPLMYVFILVPRHIRDFVYDWVARHRYNWFGRRETCRLPTPEEQARFV
ncbi:MAG: thiol-disulfide oxidoreductase DCC family protein [Rubricoccaceae bacterium]|nr:thiol-disulfide oxidoreductase DCC family protein [Rubricoccaceae bacterium]